MVSWLEANTIGIDKISLISETWDAKFLYKSELCCAFPIYCNRNSLILDIYAEYLSIVRLGYYGYRMDKRMAIHDSVRLLWSRYMLRSNCFEIWGVPVWNTVVHRIYVAWQSSLLLLYVLQTLVQEHSLIWKWSTSKISTCWVRSILGIV